MSIPLFGSVIGNLTFVFSGDARKLREEHETLRATVGHINEFMGKMLMMLHARGSLSDEELADMIKHFTQIASPNLTVALSVARKNHNPLTPEEANRLEYFVGRANEAHPFSLDEIREYQQVVEKAKSEPGAAANPWPLIALAAFLLGLWLGAQKD